MKFTSLLFLLMLIGLTNGMAQSSNIDEIVAIVGDEVILRSDLEGQLNQMKAASNSGELKCQLLDQIIQKKILLARAKADSLKVNDEQVESELNRRVEYFAMQIGSTEKLEAYYNKSILEIKSEFRKTVKDQILAEQMQSKILGSVEVTPQYVKEFFKSIPTDSLPVYGTEVELAQIVCFPKYSKEEKQVAIDKLKKIRQDIVNGASFETKAVVYSQDNGSAIKRGDLGLMRADAFVPEFAAATLKLKKDSLSGIVETKFGFHLIKLLERKGELVHAQHILIKPEIGEASRAKTKHVLDSLKDKIENDTLRFEVAALLYSDDADTKNRGGNIVDTRDNSSHIAIEDLDGATFESIDKLIPGKVSDPIPYKSQDSRDGFRLIKLKSKTIPHKANMIDDYPKVKQMALEKKKADKLQEWFNKYLPLTYLKVDDSFKDCSQLAKYKAVKTKSN